jgi:hypothetical protein
LGRPPLWTAIMNFHVVDAGPVAGDYLSVGVEEASATEEILNLYSTNHGGLRIDSRSAVRSRFHTRNPGRRRPFEQICKPGPIHKYVMEF